MGEIYRGVVSESEAWSCRPSSRIARRRRMEIRRLKFVAGVASTETGADGMGTYKKQKLQVYSSPRSTDSSPCSRDCQNPVENCGAEQSDENKPFEKGKSSENIISSQYSLKPTSSPSILSTFSIDPDQFPKFGVTSVCGRRRDMEDAVAIHPSFCRKDQETTTGLHFFGVYDGHGCSHVRFPNIKQLLDFVQFFFGGDNQMKCELILVCLSGPLCRWR